MRFRASGALGASAWRRLSSCSPQRALAAHADPAPGWNGWFRITFHTDQKAGTSIAAHRPRSPAASGTSSRRTARRAVHVRRPWSPDRIRRTTSRSRRSSTGTGRSGHTPAAGDGTALLPDGTITYDPASSVITYSPQPDGSLTGTFATNIGSGASGHGLHPGDGGARRPGGEVARQIGIR